MADATAGDLGQASQLVRQNITDEKSAEAQIKQRDSDIESMIKDMAAKKFDRPEPALDLKPFEPPAMEDPAKAWGKPTSLLAMIASFATRRPLTTALMSATAAINAVQSKNAAEYQTAFDAWKTNTDIAFKRATWENDQYRNALDLFEKDFDRGMQTIQALGTLNKDPAMILAMRSGNISDIVSLVDARANATRAGTEAMEKAATIGEQVGEWKKWIEQNPNATLDQRIAAHQRIFPSTASVGLLRESQRVSPATADEVKRLKDRYDKADADYRALLANTKPSSPQAQTAYETAQQAYQDWVDADASMSQAGATPPAGGPAAGAAAPSDADIEYTAKLHHTTVAEVRRQLGLPPKGQ